MNNSYFKNAFIINFCVFMFSAAYPFAHSSTAAAAELDKNDTAEISTKESTANPKQSNVDIKNDIKALAEMNRKIFMLEQVVALKISNATGNVETQLNQLYSKRESLSAQITDSIKNDPTDNSIKALKTGILNLKLYEAAGFDSLITRIISVQNINTPNTGSQTPAGFNQNDALLELKSYIQLETSRLNNPVSYENDVVNFVSTYKDNEVNAASDNTAVNTPSSNTASEIDPKLEKLASLSPTEITPEPNATGEAIDKPIIIKFSPEKIKSAGKQLDVTVNSINIHPKYSKDNAGTSQYSSKTVDFKWNAETCQLTITPPLTLERKSIYNVAITFNHKINSSANDPTPTASGTAENSIAGSNVQGASSTQSAPASIQFARSQKVQDGVFKKVDINLVENKIDYKLEWNFETLGYKSVSSNELDKDKTAETEINDSAEVNFKDKRDTGEAALKNKTVKSTADISLNKKILSFSEFEKQLNTPMIIMRNPEGPYCRRNSSIFVVFSTDIDEKSIKGNTMTLYHEKNKGNFEQISGNASLSGRKLEFKADSPLEFGKNYKVAVNEVKTKSGLIFNANETYFFRTAPGIIEQDLPIDGKKQLNDTFSVTLSEEVKDLKIKIFKVEKTETELDFKLDSRLSQTPGISPTSGIQKIALNSDSNALNPLIGPLKSNEIKTTVKTDKKKSAESENKEKLNETNKKIPVTIYFKPQKAFISGQKYKIDIYSETELIDNGIIKFTAK